MSDLIEKTDQDPEFITHERAEWEDTLQALQDATVSSVSIRKKATRNTRRQVEEAFHDAFELIGGVPRLAIWANDFETEFYRLYSKMIPRESKQEIDASIELVISPTLAPSVLDQPPPEKVINPSEQE